VACASCARSTGQTPVQEVTGLESPRSGHDPLLHFRTMKTSTTRFCAVLLLVLFSVQSTWATCGGGGGGGVGGMSGGGGAGAKPEVYYVPWKNWTAKDPAPQGLVLYWFPATQEELKKSSLLTSRPLSLYAAQCISMKVADYHMPDVQKVLGDAKPPVAILAAPDGSVINKAEGKNNFLKAQEVEKLVESELKQRDTALEAQLKEGKEKEKAGDNAAAIKLFQTVVVEKCMFPKKAKDAAKELKKLGVQEVASVPENAPIFERQKSALIEQTMVRGLRAEISARYLTAEKLYLAAARMDPADPTPLRYLGELYRHHIGDWDRARTAFDAILNMPADPLSRAVALHGLGKITIHEGEFKKGLALMEQSIAEFPLALAYRNLAVYWNSESDPVKGNAYTKQALALDPKDPYNLVFAAVFMAAGGEKDAALKIARANINLLPASYNLAGIYAQAGQRDKALALLHRHFYQYERNQSVRSKEMMEARVDAVFDSLRHNEKFLALTSGADGRLQMPMKGMTGARENR
jgi:tetratricopeptide (TPR) repeat protein